MFAIFSILLFLASTFFLLIWLFLCLRFINQLFVGGLKMIELIGYSEGSKVKSLISNKLWLWEHQANYEIDFLL